MKTKNKDEYIANRAAELKEWSAQIELVALKTEKSVGVVKLKYLPELNLLRAKQHAAFEMIQELENASDDAWGVKESADQVWDELRASLANAALIFKVSVRNFRLNKFPKVLHALQFCNEGKKWHYQNAGDNI